MRYVSSVRTWGRGNKPRCEIPPEHDTIYLFNCEGSNSKLWNRLPREVLQSLSSDIFKTWLEVLGNWENCCSWPGLSGEDWTIWSWEVPSKPNNSVSNKNPLNFPFFSLLSKFTVKSNNCFYKAAQMGKKLWQKCRFDSALLAKQSYVQGLDVQKEFAAFFHMSEKQSCTPSVCSKEKGKKNIMLRLEFENTEPQKFCL